MWARIVVAEIRKELAQEQRRREANERERSSDAIVRHKAAIAAGSLTDTAFAPIAPVEITAGFLQAVRARSLLGRLPTRRVPFRVAVPVQNTGPAFTWTG